MRFLRRHRHLIVALLAGPLGVLLSTGIARADMGLPPF